MSKEFKDISDSDRQEAINWANSNVFKFRWAYDNKRQLLIVSGIDRAVRDLFDVSTYFQNSCDQNYDREAYEGLKDFEDIYDKWISADEQLIIQKYNEKYHEQFDEAYGYENRDEELEYYRQTFAYEEIEQIILDGIDDEENTIYLSLFGNYETDILMKFIYYCHNINIEKHKQFFEETKS